MSTLSATTGDNGGGSSFITHGAGSSFCEDECSEGKGDGALGLDVAGFGLTSGFGFGKEVVESGRRWLLPSA